MLDQRPTDSRTTVMTASSADDDTVANKHAAPLPAYLVSEMSRARLIETMESLHFNSRGECRVVLDEGVRDFLVRAIKPPR
jgi:hypothetical protein